MVCRYVSQSHASTAKGYPQAINISKCKAVIVTSIMIGQIEISVIVFTIYI